MATTTPAAPARSRIPRTKAAAFRARQLEVQHSVAHGRPRTVPARTPASRRRRRLPEHGLDLVAQHAHRQARQVDAAHQPHARPERHRRRARTRADPARRTSVVVDDGDLALASGVRRHRDGGERTVGETDAASVAVLRVDPRRGRSRAAAEPGRHAEQQREADARDPDGGRGGCVDRRQRREVEPVDRQRRGQPLQVGGPLRDRGHRKGQREHRAEAPQRHGAAGSGLRLGEPLNMGPHHEQQHQRHADVKKHHQREQPVGDGSCGDEVAHQRGTESGQGAEPFGGRRGDEQRHGVPDHPVADHARRDGQPQRRHAAHPRVPAKAAKPPEHQLAQQVQDDHGDERVRRVAVQAAHHAARPPLAVRQRLDRRVRAVHAGVVEDVQVAAGQRDQPEQVEAQAAQLAQRIVGLAADPVEPVLERTPGARGASASRRLDGPLGQEHGHARPARWQDAWKTPGRAQARVDRRSSRITTQAMAPSVVRPAKISKNSE
ncbi:MAG: hypothetical protein U1F17_10295 [Burkholderiaceae bacterium]